MSPPAGLHPAEGQSIRATNPVSGQANHIPRRWVRDAIRVCLDLGYVVSGAQAWALLKEWREWRGGDAHRFVVAEFRTYVQRRGDLLVIRSKKSHDWRTHT